MKKLINAAENVVSESLAGFCAAHSDIVRLGGHAQNHTSATLPGLRCRRCTNGACSPRRTMSECAAQNPARLSLTTFSAALINFFILPSPFAIASASGILDQPSDFLRELAQ